MAIYDQLTYPWNNNISKKIINPLLQNSPLLSNINNEDKSFRLPKLPFGSQINPTIQEQIEMEKALGTPKKNMFTDAMNSTKQEYVPLLSNSPLMTQQEEPKGIFKSGLTYPWSNTQSPIVDTPQRTDVLNKHILETADLKAIDDKLGKLDFGIPMSVQLAGKTNNIASLASPIVEDIAKVESVKNVGGDLLSKAGGLVGAANIATGLTTAANIYTSIKGIEETRKMKPTLIPYRAPLEAEEVELNVAAQKANAEQSIEKETGNLRDQYTRLGIVPTGVIESKSLYAKNDFAGNIEEQRNQVNTTNAGLRNQINQYNDQSTAERDTRNAAIIARDQEVKSALLGQAYGNIIGSVTDAGKSIFGNTLQAEGLALQAENNQLDALAASPNPSAVKLYEDALKRKIAREKRIFGNV